jgi:hypothetical protein
LKNHKYNLLPKSNNKISRQSRNYYHVTMYKRKHQMKMTHATFRLKK